MLLNISQQFFGLYHLLLFQISQSLEKQLFRIDDQLHLNFFFLIIFDIVDAAYVIPIILKIFFPLH